MSNSNLVGRQEFKVRFPKLLRSKKSEFLAVYGRRRVGKTFLIKEFFHYEFDFFITGMANATTAQQLFNFDTELSRQSNLTYDTPSKNWLVAFQRLREHLESRKKQGKLVVFIDELPWMDTHGSDFLMGLEHFWNTWATHRMDILLIVCGSAASWMLTEVIYSTGGLHNRVTAQMKIEPFCLGETEEMLIGKGCHLDRYQIIQLYMCLGGIPYYLDAIEPGKSAPQIIQELFFEKSGLLRNEFQNLYRALFKRHEIYEKVVEVLSLKTYGISRNEIIKNSALNSGGTLSKVLADLEESGFISSYPSLDGKQKNTIYRLTDYFTSFYFRFLQKSKISNWLHLIDQPRHRVWQGFMFEQVSIDHVQQIKKALGISGIQAELAAWRGSTGDRSAQIDILIDRRDHVITICECKFSLDNFTISKDYADSLRSKIAVFKEVSKTKKAVHLALISTYGVRQNSYSNLLITNEVKMDALFDIIV
ncbi:AAA family ATPase [Algoriphagus marincola]|uniref:AAA family ATPase n=1 Tax=Algoriphagus marincola TaxID=264027 RepID=UPI00040653B9|nr:ATP-binding protein [Algoriphagus marincola]